VIVESSDTHAEYGSSYITAGYPAPWLLLEHPPVAHTPLWRLALSGSLSARRMQVGRGELGYYQPHEIPGFQLVPDEGCLDD